MKLRDFIKESIDFNNPYNTDKKIKSLYKKLTGKTTRKKVRNMGSYIILNSDGDKIGAYKNGKLWIVIDRPGNTGLKKIKKVVYDLVKKENFIIDIEDDRFPDDQYNVVLKFKKEKTTKDIEKPLPKITPIKLEFFNKMKKTEFLSKARNIIHNRKIIIDEYNGVPKFEKIYNYNSYVFGKMIEPYKNTFIVYDGFDLYHVKNEKDGNDLIKLMILRNKMVRSAEISSWNL